MDLIDSLAAIGVVPVVAPANSITAGDWNGIRTRAAAASAIVTNSRG